MAIEQHKKKLDLWYERMVERAFTAAILSYPGMSMEVLYGVCVDMEKDREASYRTTKQGAFEASFAHYDALEDAEDLDDEKNPYLSDNGAAADMVECFDSPLEEDRAMAFERARKRILRSIPECWPTMKRIFKNGKDRYTSICEGTLENMQRANKSKRQSSRGRYGKRANITQQRRHILDTEKNY